MLRVTASAIALLLGVAACAGPTTIESNPVGTHPVSKHVALANVDVEPETISADTRPRYEGSAVLMVRRLRWLPWSRAILRSTPRQVT